MLLRLGSKCRLNSPGMRLNIKCYCRCLLLCPQFVSGGGFWGLARLIRDLEGADDKCSFISSPTTKSICLLSLVKISDYSELNRLIHLFAKINVCLCVAIWRHLVTMQKISQCFCNASFNTICNSIPDYVLNREIEQWHLEDNLKFPAQTKKTKELLLKP